MKLKFFNNPKTMSTQAKKTGLKRPNHFYTKEQLTQIEGCIALEMRTDKIVQRFMREWDKPLTGLTHKVREVKRNLKRRALAPQSTSTIQVVEETTPMVQEMELQMTEGSTFDCKPSRVTICKDHIRIYF
jgi:hypothetical protein